MRSAATVEVIVEAAARILEERGVEGYSTNAIAERAGFSIGSLYQYFPSKEALTVALIERETAQFLAAVKAAGTSDDRVSGLRQLILAAVAHQMRRPILARLLDAAEQRLPLERQNAHVTRTVEAAISSILGDSAPCPQAASDVLAIVKGLVDAAGTRGETAAGPLEARVTRAVFGYLGIPDAK